MVWGFLRETKEDAAKAGVDKDTGLCRTGLEEYLKIIYPDVDDWIHDKPIGKRDGKYFGNRPDYISEKLKIAIEFDGVQHYTSPANIRKDEQSYGLYASLGYKLIRIPYFIQLSKDAVKALFGVEVEQELFDEQYPSLGVKGGNTPAYLCYEGVKRMAREFRRFPNQYEVNIKALHDADDSFMSGVELLEGEYNKLMESDYYASKT